MVHGGIGSRVRRGGHSMMDWLLLQSKMQVLTRENAPNVDQPTRYWPESGRRQGDVAGSSSR